MPVKVKTGTKLTQKSTNLCRWGKNLVSPLASSPFMAREASHESTRERALGDFSRLPQMESLLAGYSLVDVHTILILLITDPFVGSIYGGWIQEYKGVLQYRVLCAYNWKMFVRTTMSETKRH